MRVFISQAMRGLSDEEILNTRQEAMRYAKQSLATAEGDKIEFIDSFFQEAPVDTKPLWYIAKSIELLSTADVCLFVGDWQNARGCFIEHECCVRYGIPIVYFK